MGSQKPEMDPKVGCFQSKKWEVHSGIWKTNMAMEHEPFEDVFPIEDIPARYVSLPLGTLGNLVLAHFVGNILSCQDRRNGCIKAKPCDVKNVGRSEPKQPWLIGKVWQRDKLESRSGWKDIFSDREQGSTEAGETMESSLRVGFLNFGYFWVSYHHFQGGNAPIHLCFFCHSSSCFMLVHHWVNPTASFASQFSFHPMNLEVSNP